MRVLFGPIRAHIFAIFNQILIIDSMWRAQSLTITSPWPEIEFLVMLGRLHATPNAYW